MLDFLVNLDLLSLELFLSEDVQAALHVGFDCDDGLFVEF